MDEINKKAEKIMAMENQFKSVQPVIIEEYSSSVLEFKLNQEKSLNSLNYQMVSILLNKMKDIVINEDSAPRVIMMSGCGEKSFCAGGDIVEYF